MIILRWVLNYTGVAVNSGFPERERKAGNILGRKLPDATRELA